MPSLARRATAELLGSFALVFFGCGAVVMNAFPDARYGLMGIGLVNAMIFSVAVSMTMGISGGFLNPAITAGLVAVRRLTPRDGLAYVAAQLAGGVLALVVLRQLLPASVGSLVLWGTPILHTSVELGQGIAIEATLTFFLMCAVMGTAVAATAPRIGGFGVGLVLFVTTMIGGPLTGAALNPARAFGPAIVSGNMTAQAVWWIGPVVGAVAAALVWQWLLRNQEDG